MTRRRAALGGVILTGVLAAGCASDVGGNDGETHFLCAADPDCPSDQICVDGTCVPRDDTPPPGDAGGTLTCDEQTLAAAQEIGAAFAFAAGDLSCTTDADCVIASGSSVCTNACRKEVVSVEGAQAIQVAIDGVEERVCADFASQGCTVPQPPCGLAGSRRGAACLEGACVDFPPETWASLSMEERRGAATTSWSTPPRCLAGEDCTAWRVTPDGSIEKTESGTVSATSLSSVDLAILDGILRSVAFRSLFALATPTCDPAPPDVIVSLALENEYLMTGIGVTGCALVGPADNDVMRVYELLRVY